MECLCALSAMLFLAGWFARAATSERAVVSLRAENAALRHQLTVALRRRPGRLRITVFDRFVLGWLCALWPKLLAAIVIVKPETVIRWHRQGFRLFWTWKSRCKGGRPKIDADIIARIREMSLANPLWGAPRIHGELKWLGIHVAQSTVAKYMIKHPHRGGQGWKTFLRNHKDVIAAIDMLTVPTLAFERLYAVVVLGLGRRKILHVEVTDHPTAFWLANQLTEAFPWDTAPTFLIRDNDGAYGTIFCRRVWAMGIRDRPITPHSPWQNGYVERVIGSIRRECLDHVIIFNATHLRGVLREYVEYYNSDRTHRALDKDAPNFRTVEAHGEIVSRPILGGLHQTYTRIPSG